MACIYRDVLSIGPAGDDIARLALPAYLSAHHTTTLQGLIAAPSFYASAANAAAPFSNALLKLWLIVPAPEAMRFAQLLIVMACGACFVLLARQLTQSFTAAYLALAMLCVSLQIRGAHDGVYGTSLETTVPALLMLLALYAFTLDESARSRRAYAFGIASALVGALITAWTWPVILGFAALRMRKQVLHAVTMLAIPLASLIVARGMHSISSGEFLRFQEDLAHGVYFRHLVYSWFAALPAAFRAAGNLARDGISNSNNDVRYIDIPHAGFFGWCITLAVTACMYYAVRRLMRSTSVTYEAVRTNAVYPGLLLLLAPPIFGVLANQWRAGLPFGMAYDSVFLSYFGTALLLTLGIRAGLAKVAQRSSREAVALGLVFLAGCTMYGNVRANAAMAHAYMRRDIPRLEILQAAHNGFFSMLPVGDTIALATQYPLRFTGGDYRDATYFMRQVSGRTYDVVPAREIEAHGALCRDRRSELCAAQSEHVHYVRLHATGNLPRLDLVSLNWQESHGQTIFGSQAYGYAGSTFAVVENGDLAALPPVRRGLVMTNKRFADGGVLLTAKRTCGIVPVQEAFIPNAPRIIWADGFYPYRPIPPVAIAGAQEVYDRLYEYHFHARFAQRQARVIVERDPCPAENLRFAVRVFSEAPSALRAQVDGKTQQFAISQAGSDIEIALPKTLPQRIAIDFSSDSPNAFELLLAPRDAHSRPESIALFFAYPKITTEP